MRLTTYLIFLLTCITLLSACSKSYKNSSTLSDKEVTLLEEIQGRYLADDIKVEQADTFSTPVANSISITIWNSKNTKLTDEYLKENCDGILKKFIESYQPENKYDFIK